jgi:dCTP deaminase
LSCNDNLSGDTRPPKGQERRDPKGGFWSAERIEERHATDRLFFIPDPADPEAKPYYALDDDRLRGASYNLSMGCQTYVTPVEDSDPKSIRRLNQEEAFVIPAGQFAFLLTHEAVHVPNNALALLALRARELRFKGLINVSGFHIDPGYCGRLVLAVYNAGPGEVHLREGQILFEVFFADLDRSTEKGYGKSSKKKPLLRIEPDIISSIAGRFETLPGLKKKIEEIEIDLDDRIRSLEREQTVTRWASALILGALIAFGVRACAVSPAKAAQTHIGSTAHALPHKLV